MLFGIELIKGHKVENVPAKTIRDSEGKILLFSCSQFVEDICQGSCCFICGAASGSKKFNNEHVFPRWLLERYNLFNKTVTLPNGQKHRYGTYIIPCCQDCNSLLGSSIEVPVSQLLKGTYSEIAQAVKEYQDLLFTWLCLLFVKVHLKDKLLRANLDHREEQYMIADTYFWPELHHIHAVARSIYTGATLTNGVIGSLIILPIDDPSTSELFDWMDLTNQQTIAVRIGEVGIVAVLNDASACVVGIRDFVSRIRGPLGTTQLRELGARMAAANADLITKPSFGTVISKELDKFQLWAKYSDELDFSPFNHEKYGQLLAHSLSDRLEHLSINGECGTERVKAMLLTGKVSFILDANGNFRPPANNPVRTVQQSESTGESCSNKGMVVGSGYYANCSNNLLEAIQRSSKLFDSVMDSGAMNQNEVSFSAVA